MPEQPEVLVEVTRYEVSVLPRGDINRKYFTLFVDNRGDAWPEHDFTGTECRRCGAEPDDD